MRALGPFLRDAWYLARPYFFSEEKWSARGLLLAIVALNLSMVAMDVLLSYWNRAFYNALQDKNWDDFIALLLTWKVTDTGIMPGFCGVAAIYIVVYVYRTYLRQWLQIRWRRWMTRSYLESWMSDRAYYRISLGAGTGVSATPGGDNPDQRISEDVRDFVADVLTLSLDLLSNVVSLLSFVTILWTLSGPFVLLGVDIPGYMVWVALLYAVAGTWFAHLIGRPLAALNFIKQRVEADFRFGLVRLRENVEGVALYHGEAEEQRGLSDRFHEVATNWWGIMRRTKLLNALIAGYGQAAGIFPIIVAAPGYFAGRVALGGMMQTVNAFGQVQSAMSWVVNSYADLARWRATVERLATFDREIVRARAVAGTGVALSAAEGTGYRIEDVTLALPDGRVLMHHADLVLERGASVVVTGRSGSGKSTLFRALAGVWPFGSGQVGRPSGTSLFLPQRPYFPLGTLRHAVAYPAKPGDFPPLAIEAAMRQAGLEALLPRLDHEEKWGQALSGGEQQRLAVARALLLRPDWLFLDEATASLDPESEAELYAALKRELPNTTLVSIAHRDSVVALHARRLVFQKNDDGTAKLTVSAIPKAAE